MKYRSQSVFWCDMGDQGIRADWPEEIHAELDETQGWGVQRQINISTLPHSWSPGGQGLRWRKHANQQWLGPCRLHTCKPGGRSTFSNMLVFNLFCRATFFLTDACCSCCLQGVNRQTAGHRCIYGRRAFVVVVISSPPPAPFSSSAAEH